ncbi:spermidine N1-acetyltransferase [Escherichia coli]
MPSAHSVKLRPLEREDLRYVHQLDNNASVMRYWFEEPYEAFVELSDLYDKHIHDQSERRFVVECDGEKAGLVELVEINHVHRRAEFRYLSSRSIGERSGNPSAKLAMDYGFTVLNLYKLYLIVDKENEKAIHIYRKLGFSVEGESCTSSLLMVNIVMPFPCVYSSISIWQSTKRPGQTLLKPTAQ